jgi:hypothetical protein
MQRKKGSTRTETLTVADANGAVDLTGTTVKIVVARSGATTPKVFATCTVSNQTTAKGQCVWTPVANDVNETGAFLVELHVTWGSGEKWVFPSDGYLEMVITDSLPETP